MENRVELIKDIIHLLPANYEYTGPKHTKSAFSAPATPIGRVEEQRPKTPAIAVPPMPVSGGSGMLGEVVQTSPVVASYVN